MKPYTSQTAKGRTVGGDDIHHRTADQPKSAAQASAKSQRKAARQSGIKACLYGISHPNPSDIPPYDPAPDYD